MTTVELHWPGKASAQAQAVDEAFPDFQPVAQLAGGQGSSRRRAGALHVGPRLFPSPPQWPGKSHALLEGDNLHALRALHAAGADFHFIYIDPPYNSGQTFTFRDTQGGADTQASWLSFMYPRLAWARRVLREDGALFVSIDDRQCAALTLILDEIFGKENHVATLKWRKKRKPSFLDAHCGSVIEYVLVYARHARKLPRLRGNPTEEATRPVLNAPNAEVVRILRGGTEARCPDGLYAKGAYVNRTLGIELLDAARVVQGHLVEDVRVRGRFRVSQAILDKTVFITPQFGLRRHVLPEEATFKHASDDCTNWPTNEDAEAELRAIFGKRVFDYAKPVGMLRNLLSMCPVSKPGEFRCLDFFAGSGTLAEAVLAQNAEDGGARLFTCVQSPEELPEGLVVPECRTIFDICLARAKHALRVHDERRPLDVFSSSPHASVPQSDKTAALLAPQSEEPAAPRRVGARAHGKAQVLVESVSGVGHPRGESARARRATATRQRRS
jgi:hypothetical protein